MAFPRRRRFRRTRRVRRTVVRRVSATRNRRFGRIRRRRFVRYARRVVNAVAERKWISTAIQNPSQGNKTFINFNLIPFTQGPQASSTSGTFGQGSLLGRLCQITQIDVRLKLTPAQASDPVPVPVQTLWDIWLVWYNQKPMPLNTYTTGSDEATRSADPSIINDMWMQPGAWHAGGGRVIKRWRIQQAAPYNYNQPATGASPYMGRPTYINRSFRIYGKGPTRVDSGSDGNNPAVTYSNIPQLAVRCDNTSGVAPFASIDGTVRVYYTDA